MGALRGGGGGSGDGGKGVGNSCYGVSSRQALLTSSAHFLFVSGSCNQVIKVVYTFPSFQIEL